MIDKFHNIFGIVPRFFNAHNVIGSGPVNLLLLSRKSFKLAKSPMDVPIVPSKLLKSNRKNVKSIFANNSSGTVPSSILFCAENSFNRRLTSDDGNGPFNSF